MAAFEQLLDRKMLSKVGGQGSGCRLDRRAAWNNQQPYVGVQLLCARRMRVCTHHQQEAAGMHAVTGALGRQLSAVAPSAAAQPLLTHLLPRLLLLLLLLLLPPPSR